MKRTLIAIGLVVLFLIAGIGAAIASAFMGRRGVTDGEEINGARLVADGIGIVAVLPAGPGKVALIDAGNDADGKGAAGRAIRAAATGPRQLSPSC